MEISSYEGRKSDVVSFPLSVLSTDNTLEDAILKMTENNLGGCAVINNGSFVGILVEGDIRRAFTKNYNPEN